MRRFALPAAHKCLGGVPKVGGGGGGGGGGVGIGPGGCFSVSCSIFRLDILDSWLLPRNPKWWWWWWWWCRHRAGLGVRVVTNIMCRHSRFSAVARRSLHAHFKQLLLFFPIRIY